MAIAPAAPEAGGLIASLGLLAIGLLAMLGWVFCRGALYGWKYTLGWFFQKLADVLDINVGLGHIDLGGPVRALDDAVIRKLGQWAAQSEHAAGYFFHAAAYILEWATYETAILARRTYHFGDWLLNHHLPKWARYAVLATFPPALLAKLVYDAIRKAYPNLKRLVHAAVVAAVGTITIPRLRTLEHELEALRRWLAKHKGAAAVLGAVGGAIALPWVHIFPRLKRIERWEGYTARRLRRLEKLLGAAGIAAVMANALGLPSWRCITRGNLGKASRAVCGMPSHWLGDILGLFADFLVLQSICDVLPWLEAGFSTVAAPLVDVLAVADAGLCAAGDSKPAVLGVPQLALPPVHGLGSVSGG